MSYLYKIKNHKTNRVYIGSTVNFEGRRDSHISQLKSKTHHSYKLQKDWNKYDETDFSFYIVKDLGRISFDELHKAEEDLISKQKNPYNVHLTPFSKPYKTPVKRRKKSNKQKRKVHKQMYKQSPYLPTHSDKVKYHLEELKKLGVKIKIVADVEC